MGSLRGCDVVGHVGVCPIFDFPFTLIPERARDKLEQGGR